MTIRITVASPPGHDPGVVRTAAKHGWAALGTRGTDQRGFTRRLRLAIKRRAES
ncbi:hypothetical protein [Amycolatopsis xylanica]|uniref:hypothetical protein n=1 Tax=Amycolatopsis xylanica TaxID=589385 RepID=UPI0015A05BB9|nr:hypothetical protein [Amycolatopsis xylanica]